MTNPPTNLPAYETPEQLIELISHLMSEAEIMLAAPVTGPAGERLVESKSRLELAQNRMIRLCDDAHQAIVEGIEATDEAIRARPYESLVVALGVGLLVGAWLRSGH